MNMETDVFRVRVDGGDLSEDLTPLTGASDKGVGGFEARGGSPAGVSWQDRTHFDSISLKAEPFTNVIGNFALSDQTTGSTTMTGNTVVDLSFSVFGPGYVGHIIAVGDNPTPPADQNDGRWVEGPAPGTVDLGSPVPNSTVNVTLWLLDADNGIQSASASILYASGDPGISNVQTLVSPGEVTITWTTDIPASTRVLYDQDGPPYDSATEFEAGTGTSHSVVIADLKPGLTYHFAPESNNFAGTDGTFDYLTSTVAITDIVSDESQFDRVTISWFTSGDAIGWLEYGPAGEALTQSTAYTAYGTRHSVAITGLQPRTLLDIVIHSNASQTNVLRVSSKDPGAWTLEFTQPLGTIQLATYTTAGGMLKPTYARRNGTDRGTTVAAAGSFGLPTTCVKMFNHPMLFSAGDMGLLTIEPPAGVTDPIAGTDANPANAKMWKLSFDMASGKVLAVETKSWYENLATASTAGPPGFRQPGLQLFTNRGVDNTLQNILKVRQDSGRIVLDCAGGTVPLLPSYAANKVYRFEFILDMESDTIRAFADGVPVEGVFGFMCGPTAKGVGGFKAAAGSDEWEYNEYSAGFDNIVLAPARADNAIEFSLADPTSGSTTTTDETTVAVNFAVQGPGYTHYILAAGSAPAPADETDPRWTAGSVPATLSLGSPAEGAVVPANLWLLDAANGIAYASATIMFATADPGISGIQALPGER
ncbi:MAG TPA: fibronectin type III domain-containing protein, partial [Phycisphaerae bacterium]|nr:fibronectin type III domain-containing protein [Phycisphaerae bacterium]